MATKNVWLTKAQQGMIWAYENAKYSTIEQAYKTCSEAKKQAFNRIWFEMKKNNGTDMRITGKSCMYFSCAYRYYDDNNNLRLRYHTYANVYDFILVCAE